MRKKTITAGDWVLTEIEMNVGDQRQFVANDWIERATMDQVAIYTHGRLEVTREDDGTHVSFRNPGTFSGDRPDIPPGEYLLTALEPTRLLCFRPRQRNDLFNSQAVILGLGETFSFPQGHQLILARGIVAFDQYERSALSLITVSSESLTVRALEPDTMIVEVWR